MVFTFFIKPSSIYIAPVQYIAVQSKGVNPNTTKSGDPNIEYCPGSFVLFSGVPRNHLAL